MRPARVLPATRAVRLRRLVAAGAARRDQLRATQSYLAGIRALLGHW